MASGARATCAVSYYFCSVSGPERVNRPASALVSELLLPRRLRRRHRHVQARCGTGRLQHRHPNRGALASSTRDRGAADFCGRPLGARRPQLFAQAAQRTADAPPSAVDVAGRKLLLDKPWTAWRDEILTELSAVRPTCPSKPTASTSPATAMPWPFPYLENLMELACSLRIMCATSYLKNSRCRQPMVA